MWCFCVVFGKNFFIFFDFGVVLFFVVDLWDLFEYEVDRLYEVIFVNLVFIFWNLNVMNFYCG